jgi:hypothetical protein
MDINITSFSNAQVGKAFNSILSLLGRNDLSEILYNWNESQLNLEGNKIIRFPGRDGIYSKGKEGGKVNITKREFLSWLCSESPFNEKVYGADIKNDKNWTQLIQRARQAVL